MSQNAITQVIIGSFMGGQDLDENMRHANDIAVLVKAKVVTDGPAPS